jgi:hypothetical protein
MSERISKKIQEREKIEVRATMGEESREFKK